MRITMFVLAVFMLLGVLQFAEETTAAPQRNDPAEDNRELLQKSGEEEEQGEGVETRGLAEQENVGEAEDEAEDEEAEAMNQQSSGNARAIITGPRLVVKAVRKVFKKPSDTQ